MLIRKASGQNGIRRILGQGASIHTKPQIRTARGVGRREQHYVYYRGHRGLAAEVLHFSASGKVREAFAHYAEWSREDVG